MNDFRAELYKTYVSGFKSKIASYSDEDVKKQWEWADYKYLQLLQKYPKDAKILEIGCGPGFFLEYLKNRGYDNALGIDFSEEQIAFADKRGVKAIAGDALQFLKSCSNDYDIILAFDFIEHFSKDELILLSRDIYNALAPGGMLLLHTPNAQGLFPNRIIHGDLTHLTIFNPNSIVQLFGSAGFTGIEVFETGPVPKDIKGRLRLVAWSLLKVFLNLLKTIESGGGISIWTQDMIGVCYKGKP
ncbi:MAG: Ubiquinone biosynthesis O-methyltransferase [Ignavibacteriaceae bacterium]|nr:Ubiquinone biosynthesis O-methyltransferase [Ignavibacteriaceae bacterium]